MEYYSQMPQNLQQSTDVCNSENGISNLRQLCERVELSSGFSNDKNQNVLQMNSYCFQLLCYLIENELCLAKYLYKRIAIEYKWNQKSNQSNDNSNSNNQNIQNQNQKMIKIIWDIGSSIWKDDYSNVYKLLSQSLETLDQIYHPFVNLLKNKFNKKIISLINKSYSSIKYDELMQYFGLSNNNNNDSEIRRIIKEYDLNEIWELNGEKKIVVVHYFDKNKKRVNKNENENDLLNLDPKLLTEFTEFVCFMESQQKLQFDSMIQQEKQ